MEGFGADRSRCHQLVEWARQAQAGLPVAGQECPAIVDGAEILGQLLLQIVKRGGTGNDAGDDADGELSLEYGGAKDRMVSTHDPEMRHGHKAPVVVDTGAQLITAVDVLSGNAPDNLGALELVEQGEDSAGVPVVEAMGTPPTATAAPARPLSTAVVNRWGERQDDPTANTSARKTSAST